MTNLEFKILNYIYNKKYKQKPNIEKFINEQYCYFKTTQQLTETLNFDISEEEFEKLVNNIFDVLKLRIDNTSFYGVTKCYFRCIMADGILNKEELNIKWFIDHLWYLTKFKNKDITNMFEDDIIYIQNNLYTGFGIDETLNDKIKIKVKAKVLSSN